MGLKPPNCLPAAFRISRIISRVRGILMNDQWRVSWRANVLAENRGHVCGRWHRSGSEGCDFPCSRVIAAAARLPRPRSLACTHADRTVHRQCIVIVVAVAPVRANRPPRMPGVKWRNERCEKKKKKKNAPRSLHVINFTHHPEDTRRNKVSAPSSWSAKRRRGKIWNSSRISPSSVLETVGCVRASRVRLPESSRFPYRAGGNWTRRDWHDFNPTFSFFFFSNATPLTLSRHPWWFISRDLRRFASGN